ncbi:putative membrane protein [Buttiauxella ferragutiae ATCC 51602]|jgi:membrane-associated phospholipid phosphatase|uniref:Lipid A 1-diphosphate synthase n=1 Tax=Buttiauxella ferragutiae ATCC 51602 TaxID=1354252 RepID=A0ABX2W8J6_9ENTR|nr:MULTISPECIES: phosphatase PAP2 family protein [Buttiauxella]MCE0828561.1 phosphatase PAP2 family protein [Buttiauxella ferragutiae]OAT27271.1 putative membrane protein [Buttiauxella ferragutiae ATCC 51602]TDN55244.1 lipid-A kinase [Buttiauxella sp. JUb87]UNK62729.1 phosphatase PAP2 family protein [Buttiauxella ferragutiae]
MKNLRLSAILALNALGLALFFSWYLPPGHGYWFVIDSNIFHFFNQALVKSHTFLLLVAVTNNRVFDGISLLAMGSLFFSFWRKESATGRRRMFIMGIVMLFCAVIINQLGHLIPESHVSPSLYFTDIYRVSELLHFPTKDASKDSFPGDHGLMLLIFTGFMLRYFGKKAFGIAVIIFLIFMMPRMMIGAHWFTDIFVGSLSIALVCLPWVLLTPISDGLISLLDRYLPERSNTNN